LKKTAFTLFFASWAFYALFHAGRTFTADGAVTLDTVRAMSRGSLAIPENLVARKGRDGKFYSLYGPLLPLLSLPGYQVGVCFDESPPPPGGRGYGWGDRLALATNQWVSAIVVVLLFLSGIEAGARRRDAIILAALAGTSTMVLPYSRDFFTQPLAACLVLACGHFLLRLEKTSDCRWLTAASASLGLAVLARMDMMVCLPGFAVWLALLLWRRKRLENHLWTCSWKSALLPFFLCVLLLYLFDWYRWGKLTGAPYGNKQFDSLLIDTLPHFLLSPDLSIFLHNPLLLPAMAMIFVTWKTHGHAWAGILVIDLTYLLLIAKYEDYHGGICPGPRYLLALVPLNILPLLAGSARYGLERWWFATIVVLAAIVGVLVNGYAAVVDYTSSTGAWDFWMEKVRVLFAQSLQH
jgi:4-amino-4-deoxy-L-arabinose transferase-like glycosyltransferase